MIAGLGLISVAALAAVTQQNVQRLPWSGSELNVDDLGTKVEDLVPFLFFNLLPVLGMLVVILMVVLAPKPQKGVRPNVNPGFAFAFFGYGMVFVGMLGTVLYAVDDLALQGTVFEEAVLIYIVYGAVLGVMGGIAYWAPEAVGQRRSTPASCPARAARRPATVLASFPHYIAGFLDQPAGPVVRQRRPRHLEHPRSRRPRAHGAHRARLHRAAVSPTGLATTMSVGDDPWDGQTLEWATTSPAPGDNFVDVPVVHSAEPLLDLKAAATSTAATTDGSSN